ncbi:hypothetical protein ACO0TE_07540 [Klebsiella quasipneumoniae]|uniref:hypothetical protein n=1 Tax=Klebsiella quasipneumoniae TaxID=1463165 RepID=UPI003BF19BB9
MTKSTITRERAQQIFLGNGPEPSASEERELARMALAAMDSESWCLPLDYLQGQKDGLEWAAQLAEANHPETGDWLYDDPIELAKAIRKGPDMPPAQPAPVVPEKCPAEIRDLIDSHSDALFNDDDAQEIWNACRATMLQASPVCTCPSGDGSLRWPCPVHPGNSLVIPDGSASMLRRWLAFGRGMQNAGCQLPHNLIAETEAMLAAAQQEGK